MKGDIHEIGLGKKEFEHNPPCSPVSPCLPYELRRCFEESYHEFYWFNEVLDMLIRWKKAARGTRRVRQLQVAKPKLGMSFLFHGAAEFENAAGVKVNGSKYGNVLGVQ